ncbi:MAG: hypothetical protein KGY75_05395 [Candidatus Cloacimonetes bacterium]|nr:hypothetical protein [Candidatus Cloacimonadota bacterium]MBS3767533.1 hypothetical protein [Candidatus Cloacimonadota bacterium]
MKYKFLILVFALFFISSGLLSSPPSWEQITGTQYSMILIANITINNDTLLGSGNNMAAAFGPAHSDSVNDCRAIATWQTANPPYEGCWYFTIVGNENGDTISFKVYEEEADEVYDCNETITFENNTTLGDLDTPFDLSVEVLLPPSEVNIQILSSKDSVKISWVDDGFSKKIYTANDPYAGFPDNWVTVTSVNSGSQVILPIANEKSFYKVTSTNSSKK